MLPILHLLAICREFLCPNKEAKGVKHVLEGLLIKHVVLPLRAQYFRERRGDKIKVGLVTDVLREDLISSLKSYRYPGSDRSDLSKFSHYEIERSTSKTKVHLITTFLSLLFNLALSSHFRSTPNERRLEDSWLEEFFTAITASAAILIPQQSPTRAQKDYSRLVRWMLEQCANQNFRLSLSTLNSIIYQVSGLFSAEQNDEKEDFVKVDGSGYEEADIDWKIVSLCIMVDPNVFTISATSAKRMDTYNYRPPNKYLSSILEKVTDQSLRKSPRADHDYDFIVPNVLIPLCDAFSDARDLTGFLEHWREQLDIIPRRRDVQGTSNDHDPCIWEDDRLIQHIARLAVSSLTTGQFDQILEKAAGGLAALSSHEPNNQPILLSSLVITDCMCAGLVQEEQLPKLGKTVESIYSLIAQELQNPASLHRTHRWRLWRIQSTISNRWISLNDTFAFELKAYSLITDALQIIDRIPVWEDSMFDSDLSEELHAFQFLFSFARFDGHYWYGSEFSSSQIVQAVVQKLVTVMEQFCNRISHDFFETGNAEVQKSQSGTMSSKINVVETLYLHCLDYIISNPHILR